MILIADGGSTKTNWCLVNADGTRFLFNTEGYNPEFIGTAAIMASLRKNLPDALDSGQITELYYYGASILSPPKVAIVVNAMRAVFAQARIHVDHDLLAADYSQYYSPAYFKDQMDDIRIYNRALTDAEGQSILSLK